MAIRFVVDPHLGAIFAVATGVITPEEALAEREALRLAPGFSPTLRVLVDFRAARAPWDHSTLRAVGEGGIFRPSTRVAVVVADDLHHGLTRVFHALADPSAGDMRPFRDLDKACAWLGVPVAAAEEALAPPRAGSGTAGS